MYKIGSFNCLNFGLNATKDKINAIASIIQKEKFDIVALQEIKGPRAFEQLLKFLNKGIGTWHGVPDNCSLVNDYAFVWNARRIALPKTWTGEGLREAAPAIYKQYKVDHSKGQIKLIREPFFARFIPIGGGAPRIEIRLINTHIRFSKGKPDSSEDEDMPGAVEMRKREFDILTHSIYNREADQRYGNHRPSYTILLGDYNLNLSGGNGGFLGNERAKIEIQDGRKSKIIKTVQHELSTLKSKVEEGEDIFSNNYDHFTYDAIRFGDSTVEYCRINSVQRYCGNDYKKHRKNVSDHVPIAMNIDFRGGTSHVEDLQLEKGGAIAAIARESCRYARKLAGDTRKFGKDAGK